MYEQNGVGSIHSNPPKKKLKDYPVLFYYFVYKSFAFIASYARNNLHYKK